ncbi:MBL fold metallo-hydrolase [Streptomyces sp. HSG2]|uniref:MBL fold metallo-hydrolase n=1 Tax=Streptomyces sp. HSG2 TaxID=2797167 RepID=UPI0019047568|nr:MBL fold metallo-hydrolase [Streptomyces sp. HSG2]
MTVTWEELGWERIAPGVGRCRLPGWDATAGLVVGRGTALLIDAGASPAEGARLRAEARALAGVDVTHLALTHAHFDHVLGAGAFPRVEAYGARGMASAMGSAAGRDTLRADAVAHGLDPAEAAEAVAAPGPVPREVAGERALDLGGGRRALLVRLGPAHAAHDMAVLVPGEPVVVFCGDLVEESGPPQEGPDTDRGRWPAALDRLLALGGDDARYVPGHGAVVDADFVRAQRASLAGPSGVSR